MESSGFSRTYEWEKLLRKVVKALTPGTYDKALVNHVLALRGFEPVQ